MGPGTARPPSCWLRGRDLGKRGAGSAEEERGENTPQAGRKENSLSRTPSCALSARFSRLHTEAVCSEQRPLGQGSAPVINAGTEASLVGKSVPAPAAALSGWQAGPRPVHGPPSLPGHSVPPTGASESSTSPQVWEACSPQTSARLRPAVRVPQPRLAQGVHRQGHWQDRGAHAHDGWHPAGGTAGPTSLRRRPTVRFSSVQSSPAPRDKADLPFPVSPGSPAGPQRKGCPTPHSVGSPVLSETAQKEHVLTQARLTMQLSGEKQPSIPLGTDLTTRDGVQSTMVQQGTPAPGESPELGTGGPSTQASQGCKELKCRLDLSAGLGLSVPKPCQRL